MTKIVYNLFILQAFQIPASRSFCKTHRQYIRLTKETLLYCKLAPHIRMQLVYMYKSRLGELQQLVIQMKLDIRLDIGYQNGRISDRQGYPVQHYMPNLLLMRASIIACSSTPGFHSIPYWNTCVLAISSLQQQFSNVCRSVPRTDRERDGALRSTEQAGNKSAMHRQFHKD